MEMETTEQNDPQFTTIRSLLDRYLRARESGRSAGSVSGHLDEDSMSAFVEGTISERESGPVISHLVACSFCRHVTAELITLDAALAGNAAVTGQPLSAEPSRVSEVLSGVLDRIFGSTEPAVFAHSDDEDENNKNGPKPEE